MISIIEPSFIIEKIPTVEDLKAIEQYARVCYKSEDKTTDDSYKAMIKMLINRGHHTALEHANMTVRFICDRGVSHELVRHRLASFNQESTRYVNYANKGAEFVNPLRLEMYDIKDATVHLEGSSLVEETYRICYDAYTELLNKGISPQIARCVLPNGLKTEIVITANLREWRHIFALRAIGTTGPPHPQMQELMLPLLQEVAKKLPEVFGDLINGI